MTAIDRVTAATLIAATLAVVSTALAEIRRDEPAPATATITQIVPL